MIAYKAFEPGLICRGYQFKMGLNVTDKANCAQNGFHSVENPLDCLNYYHNMDASEYYLVDVGGDIDEDGHDTRVSCTELRIIKKLSKRDFFLHALAYMVDHPKRKWSSKVSKERAEAKFGYAVVRGIDPIAKGDFGDILAFAKENPSTGKIEKIALACVDGTNLTPERWYDVELIERKVDLVA